MRRLHLLAILLALILLVPAALADGPAGAPAPLELADPARTDAVQPDAEPAPADSVLEQLFQELDGTHGADARLSTCPDEGCFTDRDCELAWEPSHCSGTRKCYIAEPGCPGNCYCQP